MSTCDAQQPALVVQTDKLIDEYKTSRPDFLKLSYEV